MSQADGAAGWSRLKVVFFGPGCGGKTTALRWMHDALDAGRRGPLVALATDTDRTLFFDFLPLYVGRSERWERPVRLDLYTAPGQMYFREAQRLVLRDADGIVFVADSEADRQEANAQSLRALEEGLASWGVDLERVPLAFLYNKRDSAAAVPLAALGAALNPRGRPEAEGVATRGVGVLEVVDALCGLLLGRLAGEAGPK